MAITLFQRRNLRGDPALINGDQDDLRDIPLGRNPSSMRMTNANDAILLYEKRDWRGGVLYRRGVQTINNLGLASIASARITPFHINLNVTVVTQSDGSVPGTATNFNAVRTTVNNMVGLVNTFYANQQALLTIEVAHINQRVHDNKFNLSMAEAVRFPAAWKNAREIDFILVNSFDAGLLGLAKLPWWGKVVIVAMRNTGASGTQRTTAQIAKSLAHEIGHFLGSPHAGATNVMRQGNFDIATRTTTVNQIQEWHTKLSRNPTRRRNRREA
ncbi:MAG TPA: M12 family metallo-peptidase [Burkholderiales bacterium]|nr:M12 family metallo-peptidase [Burkholderiales bacterium]